MNHAKRQHNYQVPSVINRGSWYDQFTVSGRRNQFTDKEFERNSGKNLVSRREQISVYCTLSGGKYTASYCMGLGKKLTVNFFSQKFSFN